MKKSAVSLVLPEKPNFYNCRIKTYPDGRQNIACFTKDIFNPEKWEEYSDLSGENKKQTDNEYIRTYSADGIRMDSLKRSREKVFDIAFINVELWRYMVTFTLDKKKIDRYDADIINEKFQNWLKHSVYRKGLNYLLVAEPHKDGAVHFHGLLSDGLAYKFSGLKDSNGRKVYDVEDYPFGFARAVPIDEGTESNCCKYITKYMTKDFTKIFGKMYWAGGKELQRQVKVEYCHMDFDSLPAESKEILNCGYSVKYLELGKTI